MHKDYEVLLAELYYDFDKVKFLVNEHVGRIDIMADEHTKHFLDYQHHKSNIYGELAELRTETKILRKKIDHA